MPCSELGYLRSRLSWQAAAPRGWGFDLLITPMRTPWLCGKAVWSRNNHGQVTGPGRGWVLNVHGQALARFHCRATTGEVCQIHGDTEHNFRMIWHRQNYESDSGSERASCLHRDCHWLLLLMAAQHLYRVCSSSSSSGAHAHREPSYACLCAPVCTSLCPCDAGVIAMAHPWLMTRFVQSGFS